VTDDVDRFDLKLIEQFDDVRRNQIDRQHHVFASRTPDAARIDRDHAMIGGQLADRMRLPNVQRKASPLQQDDRYARSMFLIIEFDPGLQFCFRHWGLLPRSAQLGLAD